MPSPEGRSNLAASVAARLLKRAKDTGVDYQTLLASFCHERFLFRLDMGQGDSVWPAPQECAYPSLLEFPKPHVLVYPREAVVAEKLEAMVVLGDRNSRIKEFFDLFQLAGQFEFDRETLVGAVRRTFERRRTPIPEGTPVALTHAYWENPTRPTQVRAFVRRAGIEVPEKFADECARRLSAFLAPVLEDARTGLSGSGSWPAGGPWRDTARTRMA